MNAVILFTFGAVLLSSTHGLQTSVRGGNRKRIELTDIFTAEDFEDDVNAKWNNVVGQWKDSGHSWQAVLPQGPDNEWHYGPSRTWSKRVQSDKYEITSRVKAINRRACGHMFKYRTDSVSSQSLVTKAWGFFLHGNHLYFSTSGKEADPAVAFNVQSGVWYNLKSDINGTNVKIYISDKLVQSLDMKGEGADAKSDSYVGLWCHARTSCEGDSFAVRLFDVNECDLNNGGCSHKCQNVPGGFVCSCPDLGLDLSDDRRTCVDINECKLNNGGCSHKCKNVPGSFACLCPDPGLDLSGDRRTCVDINECKLNNGGCSHKCQNVPGSFSCSCPDPGLDLSEDRRTCVASGVTVDCGKDDMSITLPKPLLRGLGRRDLRLLNTSCQATETPSHYTLKTPLTSCGTTSSHKNGVIVFTNEVLEIPAPNGSLVTDVRHLEVPFHCYYPDNGLVSGVGVQPSSRKLAFFESGRGNFSLTLDIFSANSFKERFTRKDFPIRVALRDPLYFEVTVHSADKELSILAETCFATTSADPHVKPRYDLIKDGCAAINTVKIYKAPTPQQQRFSSELFKFISDLPFVFIHCNVRICTTAEGPNSRCAQGCRKKPAIVRRDVVSDVGGGTLYSLAEGPLLLEDRLMKTPDVRQLRGSGVKLPLLIVMVVVGALCIMGLSYTFLGKTGRYSKMCTRGCRK